MEDVGSLQSSSAAWPGRQVASSPSFRETWRSREENDGKGRYLLQVFFGRFLGEKFWFKIHVFTVYERFLFDEIAAKK